MRIVLSAILAALVLTPGPIAAGEKELLTPGKPAGIKQAQEVSTTALLIIGGIVIVGLAVGLSTSSDGNPGGPVALTTVPTTTS